MITVFESVKASANRSTISTNTDANRVTTEIVNTPFGDPNQWILSTGIWDDSEYWDDNAFWKDNEA